jgi:putative intracellular protease/amidase
VRVPLFRERHGFRPPTHGPLLGRRVLVLIAPTDGDAASVLALERALRPLGVRVAVTTETQGEVLGVHREVLYPDCLLIEVTPDGWDGLVLAGGPGARRVAADAFARDQVRRFAQAGIPVLALGEGAEVLRATQADGVIETDAERLAAMLAQWLGHRPSGTRPIVSPGGEPTTA